MVAVPELRGKNFRLKTDSNSMGSLIHSANAWSMRYTQRGGHELCLGAELPTCEPQLPRGLSGSAGPAMLGELPRPAGVFGQLNKILNVKTKQNRKKKKKLAQRLAQSIL